MVVGAGQRFQFLRQIAWFLGNNKAVSKFRYRILYNLISITKIIKNHSIKANFNLTARATLIYKESVNAALHQYNRSYMQTTLIMRNLFNYAIMVVSAKYTIKYLLSSVRALRKKNAFF